MVTSNISQVIKRINSLPSLPVTVNRVMSVTADPESSAHDLMEAILPDQSMCATILKLANSAFFGVPKEVSTLEKAVTVLGFNEIHNIVLGKAVFNSFQNLNSNNKKAMDRFWQHSFSCALTAKIIAEENRQAPSELFISGLIHDIGKLTMFLALSEQYIPSLKPCWSRHPHCTDQETEQFGINHCEAGLRLLRRWLFPDQLTNCVGYHHNPQDAPGTKETILIVQMADILSHIQLMEDEERIEQLVELQHIFSSKKDKQYYSKWSSEDFKRWLEKLEQSLENDGAILDMFID